MILKISLSADSINKQSFVNEEASKKLYEKTN